MRKIFIGVILCSMTITNLNAMYGGGYPRINYNDSDDDVKCNHKDLTPTVKALERDNAQLKNSVRTLTNEKSPKIATIF